MRNAFWLLPALFAVQASWAQPVSNRTALIIGVGQYGVAGADPLDGVKYDMVSDRPRKLNTLTTDEPTAAEPFTYALNDIGGRSALINFLISSGTDGKSESFGAKLVAIKEVK